MGRIGDWVIGMMEDDDNYEDFVPFPYYNEPNEDIVSDNGNDDDIPF